jgi:hypothetical protein
MPIFARNQLRGDSYRASDIAHLALARQWPAYVMAALHPNEVASSLKLPTPPVGGKFPTLNYVP